MQTLYEIEIYDEAALDFDVPIPCEGTHHTRGISGHDPAAPGAYIVMAPCCGTRLIQCAPRVAEMKLQGDLTCVDCQIVHDSAKYRFIPISAAGL